MLDFEKYLQEGKSFLNSLAAELQHPEDKNQVGRILKAVLHALRDRITIQQSFKLIAQLPMLLKAVYVEQWEYTERPPSKIRTMEEFEDSVKRNQRKYGEQAFDWELPTREIIRIVLQSLRKYVGDGEMRNIMSELPHEVKAFFEESISQY